MRDKNTLTILVGLPGVGKDSLIKQRRWDISQEILSSDKLRIELYGNEDQMHNKEVFQEMNKRAKDAGKLGKNVIYNATNINRDR